MHKTKTILFKIILFLTLLLCSGLAAHAETSGVAYQTHIQNIGWQSYQKNGGPAGTSGRSLRMEGIRIKLIDQPYSGGIQYRTHIQDIGWERVWKANGEMSGTSGRALRLEAIQIRLTGEMADYYDVYYRVHAQNFGWLGWAKNGASAGTAGYAYRLESIQIKLVEKSGAVSDNTSKAFRQVSINVSSSSVTLSSGKTFKLEADVTGSNNAISWSSLNTSIAIVNSKGVITAKRVGTVRIRARVKNSVAYCTVTVKPPTKAQLNNVIEINHKGYQAEAPENTIPAFKLSKEKGFTWIETDVRFTKDNIPVLLHDASINKTARNSNGTEIKSMMYIADITLKTARKYDYGIRMGKKYAGTQIPTLDETIKYCKNAGLGVVLDIKVCPDAAHLRKITDVVKKYGMKDRVCYLTSNKTIMDLACRRLTNSVIGFVGNAANCDSKLCAYLVQLKKNGNHNTIRYHTDNWSDDQRRGLILDDLYNNGIVLVMRANSRKEVENAPGYAYIFMSDKIHPKQMMKSIA